MKNIFNFFTAILFIQLLILLQDSRAQVEQDWVKTFNGTGNGEDVANAMAVDNVGNIFVTGYSTVSGNTQRFTTVKYNTSGEQLWAAVYNGIGSFQYGDEGLDIAVDDSGNVYVTGSSAAGATEYTLDFVTIKYNSDGVEQWASRYDSPLSQQDIAFALALDNAGNVYVTGQSAHPALNANIATIKYNSSGEIQWIADFDGTGNWDTGNDLVVDQSGNVYVTGFFSIDWGTAYLNFITIKYDSQGNQQWAQGYNGTGNNSDESVAIGLDDSGNIYVTGFSTGTVYDIVTIKYNPSGDQQWLKIYSSSSPSIDVPNDMVVDGSGNVFITGAISLNIGTLKYNSDGDHLWTRIYNYSGNFDAGKSVAVDSAGNVYVTGVSQSGLLESTSDFATIKYNSSGDEIWTQRYNGTANNWDASNSIALDGAGNIYVTGFSTTSSNYDFTTIKYSESVTDIPQITNDYPADYILYQNYPNPFNPSTKIKFTIPSVITIRQLPEKQSQLVTLKVYDVLGNEIATLVNEEKQPGVYEIMFDGGKFSSGIYLYRLTAADFSETKKLILMK